MPQYRRAKTVGATYFFTVVTHRRQRILIDEPVRHVLRAAISDVRENRCFSIDAWVLLPDHLHCIWTLPDGDADFPQRWSMIKRKVSLAVGEDYRNAQWMTGSKRKHRESTIWQRRYWEHRIRDDKDFMRHVDYIHFNPVKHGLCDTVQAWPFSTFHRYVRQGVYPKDWGGGKDMGDILAGE